MWPGRFKMTESLVKAVKTKQFSYDEQQRMVDLIRPKNVVPFAGDFAGWRRDTGIKIGVIEVLRNYLRAT